jgi:hypothetical protein
MSARALLAELRERGVELVADGDRLQYRPRNLLTPDLLDRLRANKAALLKLLEWERVTSPRPVIRWVLKGRPKTERSGVSEEDALRRAREEIALLEAERVRLSSDVMEGRPSALEEDEQLRQRIVELGHWLFEAEKERGREGGGEA